MTKIEKTENKFELYEDNAGGFTLFVRNNDTIIYAHSYWSDDMIKQVSDCLQDLDNALEWDGNFCTEVSLDEMQSIYESDYRDNETSRKIADQETVWSDASLCEISHGINGGNLIREMIKRTISSLSDRVEAWDKENVEQLRDLLAGCDNPEEEGIDLADLPTAQEVPEQIADYPVWSIDKHGRALVGAAADQIEDLSEILSRYVLYVIIHRDSKMIWNGDGWTDTKSDAAYYAPGQFPDVIQSLDGGYDLYVGTQINGVPDEYEPPEAYWEEYKEATPVNTDDYVEPREWLVDEYRESLYIVMSTEQYEEG